MTFNRDQVDIHLNKELQSLNIYALRSNVKNKSLQEGRKNEIIELHVHTQRNERGDEK